jgi:hypothetical protein
MGLGAFLALASSIPNTRLSFAWSGTLVESNRGAQGNSEICVSVRAIQMVWRNAPVFLPDKGRDPVLP